MLNKAPSLTASKTSEQMIKSEGKGNYVYWEELNRDTLASSPVTLETYGYGMKSNFPTHTHPLSFTILYQHVSPWGASREAASPAQGPTGSYSVLGWTPAVLHCLHAGSLSFIKLHSQWYPTRPRLLQTQREVNRFSSSPVAGLGEREKSFPSSYLGKTGSQECQ